MAQEGTAGNRPGKVDNAARLEACRAAMEEVERQMKVAVNQRRKRLQQTFVLPCADQKRPHSRTPLEAEDGKADTVAQ